LYLLLLLYVQRHTLPEDIKHIGRQWSFLNQLLEDFLHLLVSMRELGPFELRDTLVFQRSIDRAELVPEDSLHIRLLKGRTALVSDVEWALV